MQVAALVVLWYTSITDEWQILVGTCIMIFFDALFAEVPAWPLFGMEIPSTTSFSGLSP